MRRVLILLIIALVAAGCGGEAGLNVVNNTSSYVSGDADGNSFGVLPGNTSYRSIEVGGTFSSSSKVDIVANVHETWSGDSRVAQTMRDRKRMEADHDYVYEVFQHPGGAPQLRLKDVASKGGIVSP